MPDEKHTFETARVRLEEIAAEVRKKDTSLEKSLDLLEEGVRLANICTELVDRTDFSAGVVTTEAPGSGNGQDDGHFDQTAGVESAESGIEGPVADASVGDVTDVEEDASTDPSNADAGE